MTYGQPCSIRNDSVYVIQSLRPTDTETGTLLYYSVVEPNAQQRNVCFRTPSTKQEFLDVLEDIRNELLVRRHVSVSAPIIHIEVHGGPDGIQLGNDDRISWNELKVPLQRINVISQMNTLVVLSACKGIFLINTIQPHERSPAFAVIGPENEPDANDLLDDIGAFYRVFLASNGDFDFEQAWQKLGESARVSWKRYTANEVFRFVYRQFESMWTTPEAVEKRKDGIMSQLAAVHGDVEMEELERKATEWSTNPEPHFDIVKHPFYMIDLFPENAERFPVTYNDIVQAV
jgi:hypothetical protein